MTREKRKSLMTAGLFISGGLIGFLSKALAPMPPAVMATFFVVSVGLVTWAAFYCWSLLDEAQKEAHKWAWYWGGSTGLMVGAIVVLIALKVDPHLAEAIRPNGSSATFVAMGFMGAALSTVAGYGVAWAAWWLTRR